MRFLTRRQLAALGATCMLAMTATAQTRTFEVEVVSSVASGHLNLDLYIKRTNTTNFSLADANFSVAVSSTGLDLSRASIDRSADGPWDVKTDARGYRETMLGVMGNIVTFNTLSNALLELTMAGQGGPGTGRSLSLSPERLGRIRIPITDPNVSAQVQWAVPGMAIMDWQGRNRVREASFVVRQSLVPLCEPPLVPTITAPANPMCAGAILRSSYPGQNAWFLNGVRLDSTGATLAVTAAGSYTVRAVVGSCESPASPAVAVTLQPNPVPQIVLAGTQLRLVADGQTGTLQWYRNSQAVAGANAPTLDLTQSGTYHLVRTGTCGPATSNAIWYQHPTTPVNPRDSAYAVVAPNPYVETTTLTYFLPAPAQVVIQATNVTGAVVRRLVDVRQEAGQHRFAFSARALGLAAGTYLLHLKAGPLEQTFKLVEAQ